MDLYCRNAQLNLSRDAQLYRRDALIGRLYKRTALIKRDARIGRLYKSSVLQIF
jgi:hypothetical protein